MNAETRLEKRLGFLVNSDGTVHWPVENFGFLYAGASVDVQAKLWNELLRLERENEWIPVTNETLPPMENEVLVWNTQYNGDGVYIGFLGATGQWYDTNWKIVTPTHWRPLPQPPEREK